MRESAVFYESFYKASIDFELTTEQKGELFEALCKYAFYGEEIDVSPTIKGIMTLVKPQIDANNKRYTNGKKGGRPSKETDGFENEKPMVSEEKNQRLKNEKPNVDVDDNVDVDVDENEDDNDLKKEKDKKKKEMKNPFGEFGNVMLTDAEYIKVQERFPLDYEDRIENLSSYIASHGKRYKSHYATLLQWAKKDGIGRNKASEKRVSAVAKTGLKGNYSAEAMEERRDRADDPIYVDFADYVPRSEREEE